LLVELELADGFDAVVALTAADAWFEQLDDDSLATADRPGILLFLLTESSLAILLAG
jgi:hypothetical protein